METRRKPKTLQTQRRSTAGDTISDRDLRVFLSAK